MLGFHADAQSEDDHDRPEAKSSTAALVHARAAPRKPEGFILPPDFSIARRLIDEWLERVRRAGSSLCVAARR